MSEFVSRMPGQMSETEAAELVESVLLQREPIAESLGELFRPREAVGYLAERGLHVSRSTIARWARKGYLQSVKQPSGQVRVYQSSLDKILNGTS